MLDERTRKAMEFLETTFYFCLNVEKIDYAREVFNLLCKVYGL